MCVLAPLGSESKPQIEGEIVDDRPQAGDRAKAVSLLIQRTHTVRTDCKAVVPKGRPQGSETKARYNVSPPQVRRDRKAIWPPPDRAASVAGGWWLASTGDSADRKPESAHLWCSETVDVSFIHRNSGLVYQATGTSAGGPKGQQLFVPAAKVSPFGRSRGDQAQRPLYSLTGWITMFIGGF